jgi:hypothetical protein
MKNILLIILALIVMTGCSGMQLKSSSNDDQSFEAAFISTVTANGCSIKEIDMMQAMGKMNVKCK